MGWYHHGNLHRNRNHRVLLVPIVDVAWKYSVGTEIVFEELTEKEKVRAGGCPVIQMSI